MLHMDLRYVAIAFSLQLALLLVRRNDSLMPWQVEVVWEMPGWPRAQTDEDMEPIYKCVARLRPCGVP